MFVNTLSQKTIEALDSDARALLRKPVTAAGTWFSFSSLDGRDPETLSRLICSAAAYLDRDDSDDEDEDDGDFIIDADLAVGGPTIRARYESRWNTLEISASWGSDTVRIYQGRGESSYLKDQLAMFGEM